MKHFKYLFLLLLVMVACGQVARASFPCEVIDCHGRKVPFAKEPKRIVIAGRAGFMITNAAFFFKTAPEKLVSYSKSLKLVNNDRFYKMVDPGYDKKIFNDFETGVEELAAMKPDVILMRAFERQKYERTFEQLGIKVFFLNLEDPDGYVEELEALAAVFGESARGAEIADFYRSWQKKVADRLLTHRARYPQVLHVYPSTEKGKISHHVTTPAEVRRPKVLHLYYSAKGGAVSFNVAPADWIQTWLVDQAGGLPVWKTAGIGNGWQQVGFDQIAAWKPEFVTLTAYGGDVVKAKELLSKDPLWAEMSAVKQNQLFAFPEDFVCWDQPDSRWILGLCWLAATINPNIPELKTDMHKLYQEFFALYGLSPEQIAQITVRGDFF